MQFKSQHFHKSSRIKTCCSGIGVFFTPGGGLKSEVNHLFFFAKKFEILLTCRSRVICKKSRVTERHNRGTKQKLKWHQAQKRRFALFLGRGVRLQISLCAPIVPLPDATFLQMTRRLQVTTNCRLAARPPVPLARGPGGRSPPGGGPWGRSPPA